MRGPSLVAASGGHSSSRCTGLSPSRPLLLWSAGSAVVAHGPSCSAACGILPDQGSNPRLLHWQADSQPLCHQGSPNIFFFFFLIYFYLFMAVLGLRFCARAFSSCGKWGPLLIALHGPLTIAASLVAEHRLQMRRLSNCGSRAQLLHGMWDLPGPGLEPVSPALAGRFLTTVPPGEPPNIFLILHSLFYFNCIS